MILRSWLITWISLLGTIALGAVPSTLTYQGRLLDNLGHPISGSVSVSIGIFTNDQGGTAAYVENVGQVVVQNSIYSFQFGTNSTLFLDVFARPPCWLEVVIDGDHLSPRQKLLSVPYAIRSSEVDSIDSNTTFVAGVVPGTALADSAVSSNKLAAGSVGVPHLSEVVDRRYVKVTGDTMTGSLVVSNNVTISGTMTVAGIITNATYYGNGIGLTNIPASAVAEADPIWVAASNGIQIQIDSKTPLTTYQAGTGSLWTAVTAKAAQSEVVSATNDLWTALGNESAVRGSEDGTLSNQVAALDSGKLSSNIWAFADSTTNYVQRTGDTISGALTVSSNLYVSGAVRVDGIITNATYYGNGVGLTNIPASAVAEADPIWAAASNGIQIQIDSKTPLATYQAGTGSLWTAVTAKAAQSEVVSATNDLWTALGNESAVRGSEDGTLSNQVAALDSGKLSSNIWAFADSTTNYVQRTGDTISGALTVSSNLYVSGAVRVDGIITNATYYGNGVGLTNIPASAVAEADPIWAVASNGIQGQIDDKTPLATYQAGTGSMWTVIGGKADSSQVDGATNDLWTALGNESAVRGSEDVTLSNQVAALDSDKLSSNIWAFADSTTNYVQRTGDTISGALTVSSNLHVSGAVRVDGIITNATYYGNGVGLTNIPASAVAEADPIWAAASNGIQGQIDSKTPLVTYQGGALVLWTAIGNEGADRSIGDATLRNQVAALDSGKLGSNAWTVADSTTNYVRRTGDTLSGALTVGSNLTVSGTMTVAGIITNATYYGNGVGLTNIPASAVAEADPIWAAASNGIQSQIDDKTPLGTYQTGTGSLWTAVNDKAALSALVTATNDLWTSLGNESAARGGEDVTLSNQVAALQSGKLGSNAWSLADSTTNYLRRTGDTVSGVLNVSSNLNVSGSFSVGITQLVVLANGNVGIGTSDPTNRLAVNGTIKAREVLVTTDNWPDYVFDVNYKRMPLDEVAAYIQSHGHLPGVPSAHDIDNNGVGLGAMQGILLKKIEELTLQMIELKNENAEFRKRLDERSGSQGKRSE